MKLQKSIKPISYLKQNTSKAINDVHANNCPMVITQNGEAKAVLIDINEYEKNLEIMAVLKMLAQSKDSFKKGEYKTAKKAMSDIRIRLKDKGIV